MWQNSNLVACCLQYFCCVNIAGAAVLAIHDNKIPEIFHTLKFFGGTCFCWIKC
jgi:hypothetical protein